MLVSADVGEEEAGTVGMAAGTVRVVVGCTAGGMVVDTVQVVVHNAALVVGCTAGGMVVDTVMVVHTAAVVVAGTAGVSQAGDGSDGIPVKVVVMRPPQR
jgi:hypothetical protein